MVAEWSSIATGENVFQLNKYLLYIFQFDESTPDGLLTQKKKWDNIVKKNCSKGIIEKGNKNRMILIE